jgi:excinuclease ABC subunit A
MTELCDWFKVWFAHRAQLFDPATGQSILPQGPETSWSTALKDFAQQTVVITFALQKPEGIRWTQVTEEYLRAGYTRAFAQGNRVDLASNQIPESCSEILIIQDRVLINPESAARFHEAALAAFRLGGGRLRLVKEDGQEIARMSEILESPVTGRKFRSASPALFSFNSPIGACPPCRGFGRVIGLDWKKIIPDPQQTLAGGAIAPFQGAIYGESQKDLIRVCRKEGIPLDVPWAKLKPHHRKFLE